MLAGESADLGNTFWQAHFGKNRKTYLGRGFNKPSTEVLISQPRFYQALDRGFVQHCIEFFFYDSLKSHKVKFNEHWIWSDGCVGQFKSSRSFFWLCRLHKAMNIKHCWNFFETRHWKVEHDGAGAWVKRALRRWQMNHSSRRFHSAAEVVQWCK